MEIEVEAFMIPTAQGHFLGATKFVSQQAIAQILIVSSATGVLQKYYAKFAGFFASKGFCVYTFDYSGIGKSNSAPRALQKNRTNLTSWGANDQAAVVAFAKEEYPTAQFTMVTHSIGGQLLGFNPNYQVLDKVILVASQSGYWRHFKGVHKIKMWLFWYVMIPYITPLFGYFPAKKLGLFENLPKNVVYEWARWGKDPEYLMRSYDEKTHLFTHFTMPILSLSFSKDIFAPKTTVDWLANLFKNADLHRVHHQAKAEERHVKHFGFFKAWAQETYWEQCLQYIRNGTYES